MLFSAICRPVCARWGTVTSISADTICDCHFAKNPMNLIVIREQSIPKTARITRKRLLYPQDSAEVGIPEGAQCPLGHQQSRSAYDAVWIEDVYPRGGTLSTFAAISSPACAFYATYEEEGWVLQGNVNQCQLFPWLTESKHGLVNTNIFMACKVGTCGLGCKQENWSVLDGRKRLVLQYCATSSWEGRSGLTPSEERKRPPSLLYMLSRSRHVECEQRDDSHNLAIADHEALGHRASCDKAKNEASAQASWTEQFHQLGGCLSNRKGLLAMPHDP
ncbi:hypothetical protein M409DRAFT_54492 [Zasmidium cellare ATCC 36951]|uniref:Uncharacterized protein n=1 Tax=Zasmidium cellare ATCC 36951 TaxID=1080233 RepID=A0A6A6CMM5_ZASCE|nr:uncharacterized protein M409DRAFT_54492 [Zasmidium cellare ATCC 36951]KAF2166696.1 hypothetical protein M409DRAFT_54492 [Zasmidium cellare ATCC 36951]